MRISVHVSLYLSLLFAALTRTAKSNIVIACRCSDGIVIGSDSLSVSGTLIGNRVSESVYKLGPSTIICCAEGQSDFHHLLSDLRTFVRKADIFHGGAAKTSSIARYARRLVNQKYRKTHLIIAGSDGSDCDNDREVAATKDDAIMSDTSPECVLNDSQKYDHMSKDDSSSSFTDTIQTTVHTKRKTSLNEVYSVHEILSGGTLISQNNALAGSGSGCVITLMDDLFPIFGTKDSEVISGIGGAEGIMSGRLKPLDNNNADDTQTALLPCMQASASRIMRVLRAAAGYDPRSGSHLRVWTFNREGLTSM